MKRILFLLVIFASAMSFSQEDGVIKGNLIDFESNNEPLMFAKIQIKETGTQTLSDENGFFKFENLENGIYTLVYSFVGYNTKEKEAQVVSGKTTNIKLSLAASTVSLDELMLTLASADKGDNPSTSSK